MGRSVKFKSAMVAIMSVTAFAAVLSAQPRPAQPLQKIEIIRLDPRFDKLVPVNVNVERIVSRRQWVEGPVWNRKEGYLLFSDIPTNSVIKWQEGKGTSVYLKPSGYTGKAPFDGPEPGSNGLAFDPAGRLVLAEHGDRRIARLESNGKKITLVDRFQGNRINSPNDVVFRSNGDLYFTDPPFGLPKSFDDPRKETPFQGVINIPKTANSRFLLGISKRPTASPSRRMRKNCISATRIPRMQCGWLLRSRRTAPSSMAGFYSTRRLPNRSREHRTA